MLETLMVEVVGPLVSQRIFPDTAPANTPLPFVIYQKVGGVEPVFADGTLPDKENARVQVIVWGRKRSDASALMRTIKAALCGAPTFALPVGADIARNDEVPGFRGAQQDFSIWYTAQ